jgi:hypothetical protein
MVATFLESMASDDAEAAEYLADYGRPSWSEVASVAALAVRLRLGAADPPLRSGAWGEAVRLVALMGLLVHAAAATIEAGSTLWLAGRIDWLAAPRRLGTRPTPQRLAYDLDHRRAAGPGLGGVPPRRPTGAAPTLAGRARGRHRRAPGSVAAGPADHPLGVVGLAWSVLPGPGGRGPGPPGWSGPETETPRAVLVAGPCPARPSRVRTPCGVTAAIPHDHAHWAALRPAGGGRRGSPCRPGRGGAAGPARRRHAAPPHADTGRLHRVASTDPVATSSRRRRPSADAYRRTSATTA